MNLRISFFKQVSHQKKEMQDCTQSEHHDNYNQI